MVMPDMSKLQVNAERDEDIFKEDPSDVFPQKYKLSSHVSVGLDSTYVLYMDSNCANDTLAAGLSNGTVNTYSLDLLKKGSFKITEDSISGLSFSPKDPNLFYTSSTDMSIKLWDTRSSGPAQSYTDTSADAPGGVKKPLTSFSVNSSDSYLTGGTEQVKGEAYLLFWDVRSANLLGGYWNTHLDDITCLAFHPKDSNKLASGSVDGVVNVYDVSNPSEDESLCESINTESSIHKLKWYRSFDSDSTEEDSLAIITHTEDIHLWKVSQPGPSPIFKRDSIGYSGLKRSMPESTYVIDALPSKTSLRFLLGSKCSSNPCLRLAYLKKSKLKPFSDLRSTEISSHGLGRCSLLLEDGECYTGNESGIISLWTPGESSDTTSSSLKTPSSKKTSRKSKPY
eukprot:TRINITY_DN12446_c0_g1_i1.p1 TRINITY_DN12446_c0_g1~~TRINITY_DN12446_c0_g1_i1.p1  ORF type:complete len:397 (+),score=28.65 TRINITY_DN12446_c0_g1_i1:55-1245(+)